MTERVSDECQSMKRHALGCGGGREREIERAAAATPLMNERNAAPEREEQREGAAAAAATRNGERERERESARAAAAASTASPTLNTLFCFRPPHIILNNVTERGRWRGLSLSSFVSCQLSTSTAVSSFILIYIKQFHQNCYEICILTESSNFNIIAHSGASYQYSQLAFVGSVHLYNIFSFLSIPLYVPTA
mmetsp:Transcript_41775/g.102888  ORF Transcript_41775/g.102888 Transcript_41775/m.102888 type:complete len:192 (-) Transcript_41775:26-601(-)